jgi:predicted transposase YbfD/YdcC
MLNSIIEELKKVKDFRGSRGKRHELWVVLTIIFLALLTGNVSYKQIYKFRENEEDKLCKLLKVTSRKLPSYSTIRRIMIGINLEEVERIFQSISEKFYKNKEEEDWIAIDGKSLRNTLINYKSEEQNMLNLVSWFSQEHKLVIMAEFWQNKEGSETAQVKSMIDTCGLHNKIFTLDALHCSKEITQAIIDSKNDYLIAVKRNQIKLHNRLETLAKIQQPLTVSQETDNSHGRCVTRIVRVFDGKSVEHQNYTHIQSFIEVTRTGFRGGKEYNQTVFYISSRKFSAEIFNKKIKEHWFIENQVHWVKDVILKEDKSTIRNITVAKKLSLFTTLIINVYRSLGFISVTEGQDWLEKNWTKILFIGDFSSG